MTRTSFVLAFACVVVACGGDDASDTGSGGSSSNTNTSSTTSTGAGGDTGTTSTTSSTSSTSTSTTTTGTGGGGTGGAAPSGACTNAADQAILAGGQVEAQVEQCAQQNFGGEPGTKDCIKSETGLSDGCVTCFDDTVQCTVANCIAQCAGGQSPDCTACMDQNCTPAFVACSGLSN